MTSIVVQPWFNPEYYGYFWEGLRHHFGDRLRIADDERFVDLREPGYYRPRDTFAFVAGERRYFISANDHTTVNPIAADWADVYGKVNVFPGTPGVTPTGPSFGVRAWSTAEGLTLARRFLTTRPPKGWGARQLVATLRRQSRRRPLSGYQPAKSAEASAPVHYVGTYWTNHPEAVAPRLRMVRAARAALGSAFVGGLVSQTERLPSEFQAFETTAIEQAEYIRRIRASRLVLNHDAVHGCLGWKLGEYLALGKAIVTTPIVNSMPAPLVHGNHWHVSEDHEEALTDSIRSVADDDDYRRHLELNARDYYSEYLAPDVMIGRLIASEGAP